MFAAHNNISVDVEVNNKLYSALGGWGKDSGQVEEGCLVRVIGGREKRCVRGDREDWECEMGETEEGYVERWGGMCGECTVK